MVSPPAVIVRPYDADRDLGGLRRCFIALQDHEHDYAPEAPTGAELVDEYVPFMTRRALESGGTILVAERAGELVGFATVVRNERIEPDDPHPFHVELAELSVLAEVRGHGVGKQLLDAAETFGRRLGAPVLVVRVNAHNSGARRFYARCGLEESGISVMKKL